MKNLQVMVQQDPGKIIFNFEEIQTELANMMSLYKDAYFTEESKSAAKAQVAALRKMKSAIDDKRKEVKAQAMAPYLDFEEKTKSLMKLIDEPIALIDSQVKAFEEKQKQEKREKIHAVYEELVGDMKEYLPIEKIYDSKWENVSKSMKAIRTELAGLIDSTRMAVATISSMTSDKVPQALELYKQTLDMAQAVQMINEYEKQRAEILLQEEKKRYAKEAARQQADLGRVREEERRRIMELAAAKEEGIRKAEEGFIPTDSPTSFGEVLEEVDELPFVQPNTVTVFYKVVATREELEEVQMAFNSIGIYFERRDA